MDLKIFCRFVDECEPDFSSDNLQQAYAALSLDSKRGLSREGVTKQIYETIKKILLSSPTEGFFKSVAFKKLKEELVYRHILYGDPLNPYLKVMNVIWDAAPKDRAKFPPESNREEWMTLIKNAKNYLIIRPEVFEVFNDNLRDEFPELYDRAFSAQELAKRGGIVEIEDSEIIIKNLDDLSSKLQAMICEVGGINLAGILLNNILNKQGRYSKWFERYFVSKGQTSMATEQNLSIPYGYLIHLSIKLSGKSGTKQDKHLKRKVTEIINFATFLVSAGYGVERYGFWSNHFQTGDTIIRFLVDLAIKDGTYNLSQLRPSTGIMMCKKLFQHIDESSFKAQIGFSKQVCFQVLDFIFEQSRLNQGPCIIYASALQKVMGKRHSNEILAVLDFFSHQEAPNAEYNLPVDVTKMTFFLKPFIKLSSTKFCMIDRSISAPNCFETLATKLREKFGNMDSDVGIQLERLLGDCFAQRGILFHTGDYKARGVEGECDFLIESSKTILLIEFKKKVLTRASRSGVDINILIDLADSLLSAQLQAGRTEIVLRHQGHIHLENNGKTTEIVLGERRIQRIALTHTEFGSFQDRVIINQFLKILLNHSVSTSSSDQTIVAKFEDLERKRRAWCEQFDKLHSLQPDIVKFPFFHCWFLSLPQFLELVAISNDNDSFADALALTQSATFQTLDFYQELSFHPPFTGEAAHPVMFT